MNTVEGNKIIARFMGATKSTVDADSRYLRFTEPQAGTGTYAFYPQDLKYHTSWDWLMPVVEKILNTPPIKGSVLRGVFLWENIVSALELVSIEKVWEAVTQFTEWYNIQKT